MLPRVPRGSTPSGNNGRTYLGKAAGRGAEAAGQPGLEPPVPSRRLRDRGALSLPPPPLYKRGGKRGSERNKDAVPGPLFRGR